MNIDCRIYKNLIVSSLMLLLVSFLYPGCKDAEDYGIISTDTVLSGEFNAEFNDYWVKFTTACDFNEVIISSCGSSISSIGSPYLDTVLEAYPEFSNSD